MVQMHGEEAYLARDLPRLLISHRANQDVSDVYGRTPVAEAVSKASMVLSGKSKNLHEHHKEDVFAPIVALLELRAHLDTKDTSGRSIMEIASNKDIAELLQKFSTLTE